MKQFYKSYTKLLSATEAINTATGESYKLTSDLKNVYFYMYQNYLLHTANHGAYFESVQSICLNVGIPYSHSKASRWIKTLRDMDLITVDRGDTPFKTVRSLSECKHLEFVNPVLDHFKTEEAAADRKKAKKDRLESHALKVKTEAIEEAKEEFKDQPVEVPQEAPQKPVTKVKPVMSKKANSPKRKPLDGLSAKRNKDQRVFLENAIDNSHEDTTELETELQIVREAILKGLYYKVYHEYQDLIAERNEQRNVEITYNREPTDQDLLNVAPVEPVDLPVHICRESGCDNVVSSNGDTCIDCDEEINDIFNGNF